MIKSKVSLFITAFSILGFLSCSQQSRPFPHIRIIYPISHTERIDGFEVTCSEWLEFLIASKFPDSAKNINLGDYRNFIDDKLPDLSISSWSTYYFKAFLRKDSKMIKHGVRDGYSGKKYLISLPLNAWDSIERYELGDLPITGITYEQALKFCEWRSAYFNLIYNKSFIKKKTTIFHCYLPSPMQFDSLNRTFDTSCFYNGFFNYKNCANEDTQKYSRFINHPVLMLLGKEPVFLGYGCSILNLKGNAAEMTSINGIAKGGSCSHQAKQADSGESQEYFKPELWLGFRVWYKVYEKK